MTDKPELADLLDHHLKSAKMGEARLATLVNERIGNRAFLNRSSVRNWRTGVSKSVSDWRKLAAVATTLHLNETETNALLISGGCPPLEDLLVTSKESDQQFLTYWENRSEPLSEARDVHSESKSIPKLPKIFPLKLIGASLLAGFIVVVLFRVVPGYSEKKTGNLLFNPQFESGFKKWVTYVHPSAVAEFSTSSEAMHAIVIKPADIWHISFFQPNLEVIAGKSYVLRFRVRGDHDNSLMVDVTRSENPKSSVAPKARQIIAVTEDWQDHTIEFVVQETILKKDGWARVLFELGMSEKGQIWVDDIEFIVVE